MQSTGRLGNNMAPTAIFLDGKTHILMGYFIINECELEWGHKNGIRPLVLLVRRPEAALGAVQPTEQKQVRSKPLAFSFTIWQTFILPCREVLGGSSCVEGEDHALSDGTPPLP